VPFRTKPLAALEEAAGLLFTYPLESETHPLFGTARVVQAVIAELIAVVLSVTPSALAP
jgi:hypothetical protein